MIIFPSNNKRKYTPFPEPVLSMFKNASMRMFEHFQSARLTNSQGTKKSQIILKLCQFWISMNGKLSKINNSVWIAKTIQSCSHNFKVLERRGNKIGRRELWPNEAWQFWKKEEVGGGGGEAAVVTLSRTERERSREKQKEGGRNLQLTLMAVCLWCGFPPGRPVCTLQ